VIRVVKYLLHFADLKAFHVIVVKLLERWSIRAMYEPYLGA
jgi:hypothetical protein